MDKAVHVYGKHHDKRGIVGSESVQGVEVELNTPLEEPR